MSMSKLVLATSRVTETLLTTCWLCLACDEFLAPPEHLGLKHSGLMLLPWKQLMGHPGVRSAWSLSRSDLVPRLLQRTPHTESVLQHQPVLVSSLRIWAVCHLFQVIHSFIQWKYGGYSIRHPSSDKIQSLSIRALKGAASELLYGWVSESLQLLWCP